MLKGIVHPKILSLIIIRSKNLRSSNRLREELSNHKLDHNYMHFDCPLLLRSLEMNFDTRAQLNQQRENASVERSNTTLTQANSRALTVISTEVALH